jgi:DNA-binding transcriptional LysR family regulator
MALNLHHLRAFGAVVTLGGVGAAARSLGLSQPAVSRSIRELERDVGITLLTRRAQGVVPTAAGRELFEHAQAIAASERAAREAMDAVRGLEQGTLNIGASTTIATYVLPHLIGRFTREYPGIAIRLAAVHTRMLVPLVRDYAVDLALAEAPVTDARVRVTPWITDEMCIIASPRHRVARECASKGEVPPAMIEDEVLILREPESGTRDIVVRGLRRAGVTPKRTMSVDGTEVIKQLVAEGIGIAIVSRDAVLDQLALRRLIAMRVAGATISRPFSRLSMPRAHHSATARAFLRLLSEEAERRK